MKVQMQVTQHRKDHDGSTIVRLEPVGGDLRFHQVVEVHADTAEQQSMLRAPTAEENEEFTRDVTVQGHTTIVRDRRVKTKATPGAIVNVEITAA